MSQFSWRRHIVKCVLHYGNPWPGIAPTWAAVMDEVLVQS
jgi:hypothetical protein